MARLAIFEIGLGEVASLLGLPAGVSVVAVEVPLDRPSVLRLRLSGEMFEEVEEGAVIWHVYRGSKGEGLTHG